MYQIVFKAGYSLKLHQDFFVLSDKQSKTQRCSGCNKIQAANLHVGEAGTSKKNWKFCSINYLLVIERKLIVSSLKMNQVRHSM